MQEIDNTRKWIATKCGRDYTVLDADADGAGQIRIGSTTLTGGHKISDGLWESDDQAYLYVQRGADLLIGQAHGNATYDQQHLQQAHCAARRTMVIILFKSIAPKAYSKGDLKANLINNAVCKRYLLRTES